jgi:Xaa-Pro aminopeptidase
VRSGAEPHRLIPGRPAGPPPAGIFLDRRERLLEGAPGAVVLVPANPELQRSRDTEVPYRQNTDLYYLTGVREPAALALFSPLDPEHRFTLFLPPRNPEQERWSGPRLGPESARGAYGADAVYPLEQIEEQVSALVREADAIIYPVGIDPELDRLVLDLVGSARRVRPRRGAGPIQLRDLDSVVGELRKIKDEHEIEAMRVAAAIAAEGHRAAMAATAPGVGEWEVEARLEGAFRGLGATGPAFPSIVASGANATILHYTDNLREIADGDLVLVDAGAEWGMYCSDITRTFPASGRFTEDQRAVYRIVLEAQEAAIAEIRPGASVATAHDAAVRVLVRGMTELGLLGEHTPEESLENGSYRRFYMHQTSHWLGLDVHDVGLYRLGQDWVRLEPGMVLTVEPGIYVPPAAEGVPERFAGIGVRIEDAVVVTESGCEILTRAVPVDPDEVEKLVGAG